MGFFPGEMLAGVGWVWCLSLPMTASRWKQEPKKGPLVCPQWAVNFRSPVTPIALQPERERSVRSERKAARAGGALSHSTQVGRLGPRERNSGVMGRVMASASGAKVIGA